MIVKSFKIVALFFLISPFNAFSQYEGYEWGEDIVTAKGKYNVLKVELNAQNYDLAGNALYWLLKNCPKLNVSLYQRATLIYEAKEKVATDQKVKNQLQDSVLWAYDKRIEYFGDEANVLNFKGTVAWKYLRERSSTQEQLFALYTRIFELNNDSIFPINATALMYLSCNEYKAKRLSKDQLIQIYINLISALERQTIRTPENKSVIAKNADYLEKKFLATANLGCDEIVSLFGKKFNESPDASKAKRLKNLLVKEKCFDNPILLEAMITIERFEPSAGGSMSIAKSYENMNKLDSAIKYFLNAENLSMVPSQKGEIYIELAKIYSKKGVNPSSREYCLKAINIGQRVVEAYNIIGNLYFNTYGKCKTGDVVEDRSVFIAAYNMYEKAGNTEMMSRSKEQFPSIQDIFTKNLEVGDEFKVGCWINEIIILQNR